MIDVLEKYADDLASSFDLEGETGQFQYLIDHGKKSYSFEDSDKIDANKMYGCLAQVWITFEVNDGKFFFKGDSDALIVKGLVSIIAEAFSGYTPGDLKGIKLRTPKSKWRVKMFQSYGANPTPMSFSEVFTALKTGTMDGQENPYAQIASAKFQEVQKYLSITGHVYTPAYVTVHKDHWSKLPADVQDILEKAAKDTQKFVYKEAAKLEKSLLKVIKDAGVPVNKADKGAFIAASKGIYDQFGSEVPTGGALVKKVSSLAK